MTDEIQKIINAYEYVVKGIDARARDPETERAYGGIIRAGKGKLTENITKQLIFLAWNKLDQDISRIKVEKETVKIPLKPEYIKKIQDNEVKKHLSNNIKNITYPLKIDWTISKIAKGLSGFIPIIAIECKSYTENAMLKRILVDCSLLKTIYPNMSFVLVQLESQLGGDYSELNSITFGSPSTHTLLSYFDIDLNIITLLHGERKVECPIHKSEFYKTLERSSIEKAIDCLTTILERYR